VLFKVYILCALVGILKKNCNVFGWHEVKSRVLVAQCVSACSSTTANTEICRLKNSSVLKCTIYIVMCTEVW